MAIGTDRVQVAKVESTALGGDDADTDIYGAPIPLEPQEDALESAGLYLQDASNRDELVGIFRDGDDAKIFDKNNPATSLTELLAFPKGHVHGFTLTRTSASQLTFTAGECRDSADAYNIVTTSSITVAITALGVNGLDTGTEAASTPYHIFVCIGTSGICGLISASLTPTLPPGYDSGYRLIGSWINNSDSDFVYMVQKGTGRIRYYQVDAVRTIYMNLLSAGSAISWSTVSVQDHCPQSAMMMQLLMRVEGNGFRYSRVRPYNFTQSTEGIFECDVNRQGSLSIFLINQSEQFEYLCDVATTDLYVDFSGYIEEV